MISPYSVLAQQLYAQGLNPLPIKPGTKRAALLGSSDFLRGDAECPCDKVH